jgi:hypothetical protein
MADEAAAARLPWIGDLWELIDLQIDQRAGRLSSSLTDNGVLRLRRGDNFRLAVVFFDGNGAATDPQPSRLRWSLRDAANLELVASVTLNAPEAATDEVDPYYLLEPNITRLGAAAADLLPDGEAALPCVMDLDWTIDGNVYSSDTLTVVVEFGLTIQSIVVPGSGQPPPSPSAPTTPTPPTPPPPLPPSGNDLRSLFDQWLVETLPVEEGFIYVKDGEIVGAFPTPPADGRLRVFATENGNFFWAATEDC